MRGSTPVRVAALGADDWRRWRVLRLAALAEAPAAFGSTLAGWTGAGDHERRWRDRLTTVPHNLVLVRAGVDVGLVSLTAPGEGSPPELISLWVAPEVRGDGAGDTAVDAALALAAAAYPGQAVVLSVHADNLPARRLYARHGFLDAGPSPDDPSERRMVHDAAGAKK